MIEYLFNAIIASADEDAVISAVVKDNFGDHVTSGAVLMLYSDSSLLETFKGKFDGEVWNFTIPASRYKGRYFYSIGVNNESLCFKQAIYFK